MRKFLLIILATLTLGASSAFAQDDMMMSSHQWAGVGLGYPVSFYYGLENGLSEGIDLRFNATSYFFNLSVGADALVDITTLDNLPVTIYGGGGPNVAFLFSGNLGIGAGGVIGGEYMIDEQISAFLELGAGYTFYFGTINNLFLGGLAPSGTLGINFRF